MGFTGKRCIPLRAEWTSGAKPPVFAKPKQRCRGYNTFTLLPGHMKLQGPYGRTKVEGWLPIL